MLSFPLLPSAPLLGLNIPRSAASADPGPWAPADVSHGSRAKFDQALTSRWASPRGGGVLEMEAAQTGNLVGNVIAFPACLGLDTQATSFAPHTPVQRILNLHGPIPSTEGFSA